MFRASLKTSEFGDTVLRRSGQPGVCSGCFLIEIKQEISSVCSWARWLRSSSTSSTDSISMELWTTDEEKLPVSVPSDFVTSSLSESSNPCSVAISFKSLPLSLESVWGARFPTFNTFRDSTSEFSLLLGFRTLVSSPMLRPNKLRILGQRFLFRSTRQNKFNNLVQD